MSGFQGSDSRGTSRSVDESPAAENRSVDVCKGLFTDRANETADRIAQLIPNNSSIALAPDYSGCAMCVVFALLRRQATGLKLTGVPQIGLQADVLIGGGAVASIDAAAVTLGEFGQAPRFVEAVKSGQIDMRDSTCPVIHAGLQAAEKNIPFLPLRGILGSDLVRFRDDWRTLDNPFSDHADPILLVPQIKPDIALFHAPFADSDGNVWIGTRRELMLMAHAAKRSVVTVERIVDSNLLTNPQLAAGTIPALYLGETQVIENGAAPVGLFSEYAENSAWLSNYAENAKTHNGFLSLITCGP